MSSHYVCILRFCKNDELAGTPFHHDDCNAIIVGAEIMVRSTLLKCAISVPNMDSVVKNRNNI